MAVSEKPDSLQVASLSIRCKDGVSLCGSSYIPAAPTAVVVLAPALGIPRRFYARFAQFLMEHKVAVLTFDYRGTGDSVLDGDIGRSLKIQDWGARDLHAALGEAQRRWPQLPRFLLGHSLGNQLAGLSPATRALAGFVMVAAPAPYFRHWHGWQRAALWFWWKVVIPLACLGRNTFPARALKFSSVDIPAGPALQWAAAALTPGYLFNPKFGINMAGFAELSVPTLAWQVADDFYVPMESHEALLRVYPRLRLERRAVAPAEIGLKAIGHLGFFSPACQLLWQQTLDWIKELKN